MNPLPSVLLVGDGFFFFFFLVSSGGQRSDFGEMREHQVFPGFTQLTRRSCENVQPLYVIDDVMRFASITSLMTVEMYVCSNLLKR